MNDIFGIISMEIMKIKLDKEVPTSVTTPINNLVTLLLVVVAGVGAVLVIKGIMEFAIAFNQNDSSGMASGVKQFIAGLMMAGIGTVLTFLGVNTTIK